MDADGRGVPGRREHGEPDRGIGLTVPPQPEYLRVVRLCTAAYAAQRGLDVEEIEDLRIAVAELTSVLQEGATGTIRLSFGDGDDGRITVRGAAPAGAEPALDELTRSILAAVVAKYELGLEAGEAWFECTTRAPGS